jgi:hypothetical protein
VPDREGWFYGQLDAISHERGSGSCQDSLGLGLASGRGGAIASSSAAGGASTTKRQLAYKLPKWMKLAKNRGELFKTIERLRATL